MVQQSEHGFPFKINDVILAKYEGEIYYAKILSIHHNRKMARILFDDNSKDEVGFENIFNGKHCYVLWIHSLDNSGSFPGQFPVFFLRCKCGYYLL